MDREYRAKVDRDDSFRTKQAVYAGSFENKRMKVPLTYAAKSILAKCSTGGWASNGPICSSVKIDDA